jgi:hypothetical protein
MLCRFLFRSVKRKGRERAYVRARVRAVGHLGRSALDGDGDDARYFVIPQLQCLGG